jgi:hypothetical protein
VTEVIEASVNHHEEWENADINLKFIENRSGAEVLELEGLLRMHMYLSPHPL